MDPPNPLMEETRVQELEPSSQETAGASPLPSPAIPLPSRYTEAVAAGRGGMATVLHAYDTDSEQEVAIKVMERFEDAGQRQRFHREARILGELSHPGVVPIVELGTLDSGAPFLVMPWMEGGSLEDRIAQNGPLPLGQAVELALSLADALGAVHHHKVLHRDVKPGNVLLDAGGAPHLADFGISRALGDTTLTQQGVVIGTVAWMAPEQMQGKASPASDVYALGLVFSYALTGKRSAPAPRLPRSIGKWLEACTELRPQDRPANGGEAAQLLRKAQARLRTRRSSFAVLAASSLASFLGLWALLFGLPSRPSVDAPRVETPLTLASTPAIQPPPASTKAAALPKRPLKANSQHSAEASIPSGELPASQASTPKPLARAEELPDPIPAQLEAKATGTLAPTKVAQLQHTPPLRGVVGDEIQVEAAIPGLPITSGYLRYRQGGDWARRPMEVHEDGVLAWAPVKNSKPLEYWIEVYTAQGSFTAGSEQQPLRVPIR